MSEANRIDWCYAGLNFGRVMPSPRIFEDGLHWHIDLHLLDGATDDVAAQARAVVEIDPGGDIGDIGSRSRAARCRRLHE